MKIFFKKELNSRNRTFESSSIYKYLLILPLASLFVTQPLTAYAGGDSLGVLHPAVLSKNHQNGEGLEDLVPWPAAMQIRPIATHRFIEWYRGQRLVSMVYEADDGMLQFTDLPYDEKVFIASGTAVLTSQDGQRHEFKQGDHFVVPKGWTGTWELKDGYREIITFEINSIDSAMSEWFSE